jgi:ATP-dependent DNA helicase PIF1
MSVRDWIEYDGKSYIIDEINTVYEVTQVNDELSKEILEAIQSSSDTTNPAINTTNSTVSTSNKGAKEGTRWSQTDIHNLRLMFDNRNTITQIASFLQRSRGGIFSKLKHLEIIPQTENLEAYRDGVQKEPRDIPITIKEQTKIITDPPSKTKELLPLTPVQQEAFSLFLTGSSFCLTGPGGTGKSYIIKHIQEHCRKNNISCAITAMTGAAASLIGGQTLHKWTGLGLMDRHIETLIKTINNKEALLERWKTTRVLVIDEVSMMNQEMFEMLNVIFCTVRGNTKFYGDIQVIFCCDFAQLAPINGSYAFESPLWQTELGNKTIYLNHILRQDNPEFIKMLGEIRLGVVSQTSKTSLNTRLIKADDGPIQPTILYPHRKTVEETNIRKLNELKTEKKLFTAKDTKYSFSSKTTVNANAKDTETLEERSPKQITLCIGAQVMLTVNMDVHKHLVNGSRGVIVGFTNSNPDVLFDKGFKINVAPTTFECQTQQHIIRRVQIPLVLAWATTIHKCQGSTLTHAITDLRETFCNAQSYVTLSRLKSLDGLYLIGIDYSKITCHPNVKSYYECLSSNIPYTKTKNSIYTLQTFIQEPYNTCVLTDSDDD